MEKRLNKQSLTPEGFEIKGVLQARVEQTNPLIWINGNFGGLRYEPKPKQFPYT